MACCIGLCALLLLVPATVLGDEGEAPALVGKWTSTHPPINFAHIAFGEINRHGEAVGYHHWANGVDSPGARVLRIVQPPDHNGVYRAQVAINNPTTGAWIRKKAPSTFFPDAMSDNAVIDAILAAFHDGHRRRDGQFVGASGHNFMIEGWYQNGRIVAAYPLRGP